MTRKRSPNIAIGACPCPVCKEPAPLHRYRAYSDDSKRSRRAGKLYLLCSADGMFQGQDYLHEHGTIDAMPPIETDDEILDGIDPTLKIGVVRDPVTDEREPGEATATPKTGGFGFF